MLHEALRGRTYAGFYSPITSLHAHFHWSSELATRARELLCAYDLRSNATFERSEGSEITVVWSYMRFLVDRRTGMIRRDFCGAT